MDYMTWNTPVIDAMKGNIHNRSAMTHVIDYMTDLWRALATHCSTKKNDNLYCIVPIIRLVSHNSKIRHSRSVSNQVASVSRKKLLDRANAQACNSPNTNPTITKLSK